MPLRMEIDMRGTVTLAVGALLLFVFSIGAAPTVLPLVIVADVPLPGDTSRFDYSDVDASRHVLYVAHLGAGTVVVFDTKNRRVIGEIPSVARVHGVLVIPALGRVYASATGTNEVVAIDENTNTVIGRIPAGTYPDGMAYDPNTKQLFVSDEHGDTETVIDVDRQKVVATISLGGDVGNTQFDPVSKRVFVDVQTRNELVEINPGANAIVARYRLAGCEDDHSLLIDASRRLAFIACDQNAKLLTFDLTRKLVIDIQDVGSEPDVLAFDHALRRLYVSAESGVISVFDTAQSPMRNLGQWLFAPNAHVAAVDQQTHEVYFPLQDINGKPELRIASPVAESK